VTTPVPVIFKAPVGRVIVSGFGEIETVARVVTPVPLSVTGVGVTVAPVKATVRFLVISPTFVPGENTTLYVHEVPTARVAPHVPGPP
jgi:hypothetical protein